MSRESVLARTMVELADNLVDDFDVVDLLTTLSDRCVEVLDVAAAGIMLAAPTGELQLITASSEAMRLVELFELQTAEGPCLDSFRSRQPVVNQDLTDAADRWPRFAPVAVGQGFRAADAIPMRLRGQIIGALNLFRTETGSLNDDDVTVAQALADIATIAIIQNRGTIAEQDLNTQLETALDEPHRYRAGQGHDRRTAQHPARRSVHRSATTPATTTCASPTSPAAPSTAASTPPRSSHRPPADRSSVGICVIARGLFVLHRTAPFLREAATLSDTPHAETSGLRPKSPDVDRRRRAQQRRRRPSPADRGSATRPSRLAVVGGSPKLP